MKKLQEIQQKLKVPKGRYNNFGKYGYRSVEDIYEAVKPLLGEYTLTVTDHVVEVGNRVFVRATASFYADDDNVMQCHGWAEIPTEQKGMSLPQITGSASSYARKYALGGLFLLDDSDDPDEMAGKVEKLADKVGAKIKADAKLWRRVLDAFKQQPTAESHARIIAKYELTAAQEKELNGLLG